jgi:hypothetical protein
MWSLKYILYFYKYIDAFYALVHDIAKIISHLYIRKLYILVLFGG